jgi:hypothetical protein
MVAQQSFTVDILLVIALIMALAARGKTIVILKTFITTSSVRETPPAFAARTMQQAIKVQVLQPK